MDGPLGWLSECDLLTMDHCGLERTLEEEATLFDSLADSILF